MSSDKWIIFGENGCFLNKKWVSRMTRGGRGRVLVVGVCGWITEGRKRSFADRKNDLSDKGKKQQACHLSRSSVRHCRIERCRNRYRARTVVSRAHRGRKRLTHRARDARTSVSRTAHEMVGVPPLHVAFIVSVPMNSVCFFALSSYKFR